MMHRRLKSTGKAEGGAVAIIVAVLITVFIGFLAIVVDVGYMYEMRRQLQSAADGAALAAMMEKINFPAKSDTDILAVAKDYAAQNDSIGLPAKLTVLETVPQTEITDGYVKIGVSKQADLFFANIFGLSNQMIYAQAKAKRVYVTGVKGLAPWGVTIIRADHLTASVKNGSQILTTHELNKIDDNRWSGFLTVPPAPNQNSAGYLVDLTIANAFNISEVFSNVGSIVVHQTDDPIANVYLSNYVLPPPGYTGSFPSTTLLTVESSVAPTWADVGGTRYSSFSKSGNLYTAQIAEPAVNGMFQTFPVDVRVGNNTFSETARLVVRKSNSPIADIDYGPLHFSLGGGSTPITVVLRDLIYGQEYTLKQVADPETGNFMSLDFSDILHYDDVTQEGYGKSGYAQGDASYWTWVESGFPNAIHIGDVLWTQTGGGPWTQMQDTLEARFGGNAPRPFGDWEAAGKPADWPELVSVPIVEPQDPNKLTGRMPVIIRAVAIFYIKSYRVDNQKTDVTGYFVEYAKTGDYSDSPPPGSSLYMETIRLDKPDY